MIKQGFGSCGRLLISTRDFLGITGKMVRYNQHILKTTFTLINFEKINANKLHWPGGLYWNKIRRRNNWCFPANTTPTVRNMAVNALFHAWPIKTLSSKP
ncbi:hypothetical protein DPMN_141125 [Dreissena polymorpha]|uniref:Uncharacterized protein n=1 Tax=Dreissena polymorpha TaxID=45954 RepID=A0A9D4GEU2_DREPO|nr:hypothetical protein DPMN_141125 [Dreissena polymorpha]